VKTRFLQSSPEGLAYGPSLRIDRLARRVCGGDVDPSTVPLKRWSFYPRIPKIILISNP